DEHSQNLLSARAALQSTQQHAAEHDILASAGARHHECPGSVEQGCRADGSATCLNTNSFGQCPLEGLTHRVCSAAVAVYLQEAERRRRFVDVFELGAEEGFRIRCPLIEQHTRNVVAISHRLRKAVSTTFQALHHFGDQEI